MNVLQVINSLDYGGAEKLVIDLAIELKARNAKVEVLLLNGSGGKERISHLKAAGITVHDLRSFTLYNPLVSLKLVSYMRGFDVVHAHLFPSFYWVVLSKWIFKLKAKVIVTEHSPDNNRRNHWLFKGVDQWIYKGIDRVVCISEDVEKSLGNYLKNGRPEIITVNNGVDIQQFANSNALEKRVFGLPVNISVLCQVSSFRKAKDQDTVIRTLALLPSKFHLILVGDGPRKNSCLNLAINLGIEDRVHFVGVRTDVAGILQMSDYAVLSSHYEGFGLAAVEAMAAGKVVLASNVPGLANVVKGAGVLFTPGNEHRLAKSILRISENQLLRARLERRSRTRSLKYDINYMVDEYIEQYQIATNRQ